MRARNYFDGKPGERIEKRWGTDKIRCLALAAAYLCYFAVIVFVFVLWLKLLCLLSRFLRDIHKSNVRSFRKLLTRDSWLYSSFFCRWPLLSIPREGFCSNSLDIFRIEYSLLLWLWQIFWPLEPSVPLSFRMALELLFCQAMDMLGS